MKTIQGVLFDLDGTLLDTAPDMAYALNAQRQRHGLPHLPFAAIRPLVGYGSKALLQLGFEIEETHAAYPDLLNEFLQLYEQHLIDATQLFPEIEQVLAYLAQINLPWGIVTNKPSKFVHHLLKKFELDKQAACVVCGDTLSTRKPHPGTILHACEQLQLSPASCLYVGDASIDVTASKSAGTQSLVALYGYIHENENPLSWPADGYIHRPSEIISWL